VIALREIKNMKNNRLAETQKEIFDSIKSKEWFQYTDIDRKFNNRQAQLLKMSINGYLEKKAIPENNNLEWWFKK
jgi:hypothetical protein